MKCTYLKPEIEIIDILQSLQILAGSGGNHGSSVNGGSETSGENASEVENPLPGGGTRAPGFFGDFDE